MHQASGKTQEKIKPAPMSGFVNSLSKLLQGSKKEETARESSLQSGELRTALMDTVAGSRQVKQMLPSLILLHLSACPSNGGETFTGNRLLKPKQKW